MNSIRTACLRNTLRLLALAVLPALGLGGDASAQDARSAEMSFLFTIASPVARYDDAQMVIYVPKRAPTRMWSDRPHRVDLPVEGGAGHFAAMYKDVGFAEDPPNVSFAGMNAGTGQQITGQLVLGEPFLHDGESIAFPVKWLFVDNTPVGGEYQNVTLVVDNLSSHLGFAGAFLGGIAACTTTAAGAVVTAGTLAAAPETGGGSTAGTPAAAAWTATQAVGCGGAVVSVAGEIANIFGW